MIRRVWAALLTPRSSRAPADAVLVEVGTCSEQDLVLLLGCSSSELVAGVREEVGRKSLGVAMAVQDLLRIVFARRGIVLAPV